MITPFHIPPDWELPGQHSPYTWSPGHISHPTHGHSHSSHPTHGHQVTSLILHMVTRSHPSSYTWSPGHIPHPTHGHQVTPLTLHMVTQSFVSVKVSVHLALPTPPLAFQVFDEDVCRCFAAQCTAVDTSDHAWHQARLSLSRGGLGLSRGGLGLSSGGLGLCSLTQQHTLPHFVPWVLVPNLNPTLSQQFSSFNSSVPPPEAINSEVFLLTLITQKSLSSKLDDHLFKVLLDISSIADKAHLLPSCSITAISHSFRGSWSPS